MQAVQSAPGPAPSGSCLKCGEKGHWARECTTPKEKWLSNRSNNDNMTISRRPITDFTQENHDGSAGVVDHDAAPMGAAAAARQKRKRPKLTFDLLKTSAGLPDVYHNFPTLFKQHYKGKGHETSDLRRLLEMYKRWQDRIFPYCEYDTFIANVEKMGGTNVVKKDVQDMRVDMLKAVETVAFPSQEAPAICEGAENNTEMCTENLDADLELELDMDDELLELAALPVNVPSNAGNLEDDDAVDADDLIALEDKEEGAATETATGSAEEDAILGLAEECVDLDEEALLDLAMQEGVQEFA